MNKKQTDGLKRTELFEVHKRLGARLVPFAGWEMPVQYDSGILSEVRAVRSNAGMFDVSHMGRIEFDGKRAVSFLGTILSVDVGSIRVGKSRYHLICDELGGIIDDAIVYRLGDKRCLLIVNAGNLEEVLTWIIPRMQAHTGVSMRDITEKVAMIAVQGPVAARVIDRLCSSPMSSMKPFSIAETNCDGVPALIARTGYTGEDGFELMPPANYACGIWDTLLEQGVKPCGLGSRDVLRLEAGLMLHGSDMTVTNNPLEAGLSRFVEFEREEYIAAESLRDISRRGTQQVIIGFKMIGRGVPRHGHSIMSGDAAIGMVTSGTYSPTLDSCIGMGYVRQNFAVIGERFEIDIRGKLVEAEVVRLPFYRRPRPSAH